jgi:4'-phosphopantetheinyl transferase
VLHVPLRSADLAADPSADPARDAPVSIDLAGTVVVQFADQAPTRAGDHRRLVALVGRLTGVDPASITLEQVCPNCGASGHGPLRVVLGGPAGSAPAVYVSLSRAEGRLALAVTSAGPVGIDLESGAALGRAPVADALVSVAEARALAALDPDDAGAALVSTWTAKEAVLKAAGTGLRVDPRDLTIALPTVAAPTAAGSAARVPAQAPAQLAAQLAGEVAGWPVLAHWPAAPFPLDRWHLHPLTLPTGTVGLVGTVAVVCVARPGVMVVPVPPG